ncbi:MAG: ATP-binding cassette domain-containing protein [Clostridia bacterium]|nr:ATP-binding cassette domain-containing protein [Clostridia bacterium]MDD4387422.1 ATP-binding cassette domain-containing protein [Clostridia bacterium]
MLELKGISYEKDNKKILNNINLKIEGKKFVAITGPNGSGKSTLAKIIMGILKPTSGKIIFMGEDITDLDICERAKLGIGFAFQQPVKFKGITIKDLIELSLEKGTKCKGSCHYLTDVGLCPKDYMNREINSNLSGGELKRIEIATVVARKCKLTIFDEPEAGIDLWSFSNLIDVFQKMHETIKGSIVIISHQERILNIADEIILLENGKITEIGSKDIVLPKLLNVKSNCKFLKESNSNG